VRVVARGFPAVVAARYLAGAGVPELVVDTHEARAAALAVDARVRVVVDPGEAALLEVDHRFLDLDPSAREVALGAAVALDALRALLLDR